MATDKKIPGSSAPGRRAASAREERLAAALRENLRRRKAQARGRAAAETDTDSADPAPRKEP